MWYEIIFIVFGIVLGLELQITIIDWKHDTFSPLKSIMDFAHIGGRSSDDDKFRRR